MSSVLFSCVVYSKVEGLNKVVLLIDEIITGDTDIVKLDTLKPLSTIK